MVIPRSRSSFALSIWSNGVKGLTSGNLSCSTLVIAAVRVVLPWSMCPMVPMLTCGLVRSNLAFPTGVSSLRSVPHRGGARRSLGAVCFLAWYWLLASCFGDDLLGDARRHLGVGVELHAVIRPALRPAAQVAYVAEHLGQRDGRLDDPDPIALLHGLDLAAAAVQVADDVAHVIVGGSPLDGHDRLEKHRVGVAGRFLECHRACDLEG